MGADPKKMGADPSEMPFSIILRRSTSTGYPCQFERSACFPTCFSGVPVRPHPGYPRIPQDTPGYHCEKPTDTPALHHPGTHPPRPIDQQMESPLFFGSLEGEGVRGPRAQPPDVADVVLHETAISWLRVEEEQTRPTRPWEETPKQLAVRLQRGVSRINKDFDVRGLCMEFPDRLHTLVKKKGGDRLPK